MQGVGRRVVLHPKSFGARQFLALFQHRQLLISYFRGPPDAKSDLSNLVSLLAPVPGHGKNETMSKVDDVGTDTSTFDEHVNFYVRETRGVSRSLILRGGAHLSLSLPLCVPLSLSSSLFLPLSQCSPTLIGGCHRNVQRFRGGLVSKVHRLVYHSTLGLRVIKKKKKKKRQPRATQRPPPGPRRSVGVIQGYLAHKKQPPPSVPP